MIIDMHIHTSFSPCSVISIPDLLRTARKSGLDGICITDHDTTASLAEFRNITDSGGICVIVGMEYTTPGGDFLVFGPVEHIPPEMDAHDLLKWTRKKRAVAIPAHPFRKSRPVDRGILPLCTIIEDLNGRNHPSENELCRNWVRRFGNGTKATGGSDAHTLYEVGRIVTVFHKNIYDVEDLISRLHDDHYSSLQRYSH